MLLVWILFCHSSCLFPAFSTIYLLSTAFLAICFFSPIYCKFLVLGGGVGICLHLRTPMFERVFGFPRIVAITSKGHIWNFSHFQDDSHTPMLRGSQKKHLLGNLGSIVLWSSWSKLLHRSPFGNSLATGFCQLYLKWKNSMGNLQALKCWPIKSFLFDCQHYSSHFFNFLF